MSSSFGRIRCIGELEGLQREAWGLSSPWEPHTPLEYAKAAKLYAEVARGWLELCRIDRAEDVEYQAARCLELAKGLR
jgi:hypothetical protein